MPLSIPYNQLPDLGVLESTDLVPMLRPFQDEGKASMSDLGTFVQPYTKIIGTISQSGGTAPVLTIFENNTGATLTTAYITNGQYEINSDVAIFVQYQLWVYIGNNLVNQLSDYTYQLVYSTSTQLYLFSLASVTLADSVLENASFEIRIYPLAP